VTQLDGFLQIGCKLGCFELQTLEAVIKKPNLYVIAGPNGAGKTTFAREFLPNFADCPLFVNVDDLARNISPREPRAAALEAGKLMLRQILDLSSHKVNFGFETTLSGKNYLRLFDQFQKMGYTIHIIFLLLPNVEMAIQRVKDRVRQGGHAVTDEDIRRRFQRGIQNFRDYRQVVDTWQICDASVKPPVVLGYGTPDGSACRDENTREILEPLLGGL
jgi:predicted ABC-type ATPase